MTMKCDPISKKKIIKRGQLQDDPDTEIFQTRALNQVPYYTQSSKGHMLVMNEKTGNLTEKKKTHTHSHRLISLGWLV